MIEPSAPDADRTPPPRSAQTEAGMPRWVKVLGLVGIALLLLMLVMLLSGHGPGHHLGATSNTSLGPSAPARS